MISDVLINSFGTFRNQFKSLIPFLFLAFLLGNIANLSLIIGVKEGSGTHILYSLLEGLLMLWFEVALLLKVFHSLKKEDWNFLTSIKEGLYNVPAYILYAFLYSILLIFGLALLILPGLYVLITFSLAPLISILDPDCFEGYFKNSKRLVEENYPLIIVIILLEIFSLSTMALTPLIASKLADPSMGVYFSILGTIPQAFLSVWLGILMVHGYLSLKNSSYYREEEA